MTDTPDRNREENERLLRLLEAATAPSCANEPSQLAEQDEYAGLRAAWLALGHLLDAAGEAQTTEAPSVGEENKPLSRVYDERASLSGSIKAPSAIYQRTFRLRRFAAIAAVAAAACVILLEAGSLGLNWWLARAARQINQGQQMVGPAQQSHVQPRPDAPKAPTPAVVHNENRVRPDKAIVQKQATAVAKTSTWDDAIDQQIASVSQQIESVRNTWGHRVDDVDLVQYGVDDVSAELTKDAL